MSLLIQISDTHFGTERDAVVEALVQLVRDTPPELIVLSGDITQRARRSQFRAAREFVDRLGAPMTLAIPGNHDIPLFNLPMRLFSPYANYMREFGTDLEPVFESDRFLVITLKTTRRHRHKDGEVSTAQIERVAQRLESASAQQLRIVVTHQPVFVTRAEDESNLLKGHVAAIHRWVDAGADLILGGHIHLPYVRALHEHYRSLARQAWVVQAGTAVSSRVRHDADNSVNFVRHVSTEGPRKCVVERWDFSPTMGSFYLASTQCITCDPFPNGQAPHEQGSA